MRKSSLDGIRQSIGCPCFEFAEDSFDLRPEFLNRVQIRAVRWRVKTVYAGFIQKFFDCLCMVRFHVIHSYDLLNQYAMKSLTIAPDNPKAYCWLIRSLKAQGMNELATNELAAAKEHLTTEEYEEILAFGVNW